MSTQNLLDATGASAQHRIGSVSRLAGVPVSTLRMWEGRYGAFTPGKTGGRHRLYSEVDVVRARLLRQLTESGHSIGGIARLPAQQLQQMLVDVAAADPRHRQVAPRRLALVVVGTALATRITAPKWQQRLAGGILDVRATFGDLADALRAQDLAAGADMLLVRIHAVQPGVHLQVQQLMEALQVRHGVVLYNFAAESSVAALRDAGLLVRREPIDDGELADLLRSVTWAGAPAPASTQPPRAAIPAPRYSEEHLARVAASPSQMLCECPRHIADIVTQLASFEEYSARCLNLSHEDAQVHAHLRSVAGSARAMFEGALDVVLAHSGLELPPGVEPGTR